MLLLSRCGCQYSASAGMLFRRASVPRCSREISSRRKAPASLGIALAMSRRYRVARPSVGIRMDWSEGAENVLTALAKMVPETLRQLAQMSAKDEAESIAQERGANEVDVDDAMRGWIRITPPDQRNGLVAVIESLGLEPETYVEELENAEGWDEESEEPPDSGM